MATSWSRDWTQNIGAHLSQAAPELNRNVLAMGGRSLATAKASVARGLQRIPDMEFLIFWSYMKEETFNITAR